MSNTLPQFFNYDENKVDAGYEALHDFFLSWTLRCAVDDYATFENKVQHYSKRILLHLLFENEFTLCKIISVKTKKQLGYIDLLVEVTLQTETDELKEYVLNIENKWYSNVLDSQLKKYSQVLSDIYSNSKAEIVSVVLFPDHLKLEENREICEKYDYRMETFEVLKMLFENESYTENDLFDEFWFKFY